MRNITLVLAVAVMAMPAPLTSQVVFFDFGSAELTSTSRQILANVVGIHRLRPVTPIRYP